MKTMIIVNPVSAGGRTLQVWRALEDDMRERLGDFDVHLTDHPRQATEVTRVALRGGYQRVIVVGGDGSCHEVVNGFFDPSTRAPIDGDAVFGFLRSGTGGDLARTFGMLGSLQEQADRIARSEATAIDVIGCSYQTESGEDWAVSVNIASVGQGGDVCTRVDARRKWVGGALPFALAALESLLVTTPWRIGLALDDGEERQVLARNVVAANCQYHGGGMQIAPMAVPDDGQLDLVVIGGLSRLRSSLAMRHIYKGRLHEQDGIDHSRASRVAVVPASGQAPMLLEIDGEVRGRGPVTFEVCHQAIRLAR